MNRNAKAGDKVLDQTETVGVSYKFVGYYVLKPTNKVSIRTMHPPFSL